MQPSLFYAKLKPGLQTRVPPVESDDSCLSDSGDSDDDYIPNPGDESSCESRLTTGAVLMRTQMEMNFLAPVLLLRERNRLLHQNQRGEIQSGRR